MHNRFDDAPGVRAVRLTMRLVTISQYSVQSALEVLGRSRTSIEKPLQVLQNSKRLADEPLFCPWNRNIELN